MLPSSWCREDIFYIRVLSVFRKQNDVNVEEVFPGGSGRKESACNAGGKGSVPGSRRSPGEGNGNPLQYSCLENPMDRGAWWATVYAVAEIQTQLNGKLLRTHPW